MSRAGILLATAIIWCGCAEPSGFDDSDGQGRSPKDSEELYTTEDVWHIDVLLSTSSYAALAETPRTYVLGDIRIGDTIIEQVGVRLKGAFSFQGLGGKSSFKIKFNEFVPDQRFLGLEKLTLNNMRQDRSQLHESLAYQIFADASVPAPRSGFARVSLNGDIYGLYANVETMDDRFLKDRFEDGEGNLYEAPWGADLDVESVGLYEQDEGDDLSRQDLDALVAHIATPGDSVFFGDDTLLNTNEFLRFVASEAISGHWDGYWKSNNYFLYHEGPVVGAKQGTWNFMPWGLDQSFGEELHPFTSRGVLAEKCFAEPSCMAEYTRIGLDVVDAFESRALHLAVDSLAAGILEYVQSDPRSPHPPAKVDRYQEITKAHLATVGPAMRAHFSCMEGGEEQDRDEDGFGACFDDCNDASDAARPGGSEVCDGLDNDCDGQVDEVGCPCTEEQIGDGTYLFCNASVPWSVAKLECEARGAVLAVLVDTAIREEAFAVAKSIAPTSSWFIGATDRMEEGEWLDTAGAPIATTRFAPGEPDDFGGEHCAALASFADGDWEDVRCGNLLPYICQETN
tara:strand:+ start:82581 stop:84287 length:1707 start_codon:yes stop_codon:yes gene_type:complete